MTDLQLEAIETLSAGVWEIAEQLKRIADLMAPPSAKAKDGAFDSAQDMSLPRQFDEEAAVLAQAHTEGIDLDALATAAEHECTKSPEHFQQGCYKCKDAKNCNDEIPF